MKLSEAFPSNFLRADDLNGQSATVEISSAEMERIGQGREAEDKLVIGFRGKEKKLICNKTNATTIAKLWGDDTDGWIGKKVIIAAREVDFQGKPVLAIRVSLNKPGVAPAKKAAPAPSPEDDGREPLAAKSETDDVGF